MPRKNLKVAFQIFLVAICTIFIFKYFSDHFAELKQISAISSFDLGVVFLLALAIHYFTTFKIFIILKKLDITGITFDRWFRIFSLSRFLGSHLSQGGNLYRTVKLKQEFNFSYTNSIGVMIVLTWLDAIFICLIAIGILSFLRVDLSFGRINVIQLLGAGVLFLGAAPFFANFILRCCYRRSAAAKWLHQKIETLGNSFQKSVQDIPLLIKMFLLSAMVFFLHTMIVFVIFGALLSPVHFSEATVLTVLTLLSAVVNITPNNIGITEVFYGFLAKNFGSNFGSGIIACGLSRLVFYIVFLFFAILFIKDLTNNRKHPQ